jgi:uncharacterized membrane protein YgcG
MLANSCYVPVSAEETTRLQGGVTKNKTLEEEPAVKAESSDLISGVVYGNVENRRIRHRTDILVTQVKDPEGDAARNAAIFGAIIYGLDAAASAAYSNSGGGSQRSSGGGYSGGYSSGRSYSSGGGSSGGGMGGCQ